MGWGGAGVAKEGQGREWMGGDKAPKFCFSLEVSFGGRDKFARMVVCHVT